MTIDAKILYLGVSCDFEFKCAGSFVSSQVLSVIAQRFQVTFGAVSVNLRMKQGEYITVLMYLSVLIHQHRRMKTQKVKMLWSWV